MTNPKYLLLLNAYREHPAVYAKAARAAKVSGPTAKRAWLEGWSKSGHRPIIEVLEEEKRIARAQLDEQEARLEQERLNAQREAEIESQELARQGHIRRREDEGRLVRLAQANTLGVLATVNHLVRGAAELAKELGEKLNDAEQRKAIAGDAEGALRVIGKVSEFAKQANESARLSMQMERLHLGEPESILGVVGGGDFTLDEAVAEIREANRAIAHAVTQGAVSPSAASATIELSLDDVGESFEP